MIYRPKAFIFDIDGTLADMGKGIVGKRSPYDWHRVDEDTVNTPVAEIARRLSGSTQIIVVSGRDRVCETETEKWLFENDIPCDSLFMRPAGNNEKDSIIKERIYREKIEPYWDVIAVFDDRRQVVDMWRSLGLTCLQVADGDF